MSENTSFDGFLNEMMASMSQDTREAMMRRVNAERLIKLSVENLVEKHEAESIRFILDNRLTEQESADYLVQVDDYDLRLVLLDAPGGKVNITKELLQQWLELFETNPSTTVLIAVWVNDELSSIPFTTRRIRSIIEVESKITKIADIAKPFEEIISEVIHKQTKGWKIPEIESKQPTNEKRDLYSIFSKKITNAIDHEAGRRYLNDERAKAAKNYPAEQEKRVLLSILREAIDGATDKELEEKLTKLPRRGE
ncbi:MAG: hypothetical protein QY328_17320 [Anaerolineales bacterium]|nr:MAG: hypothetical protein QY328_17320 [Anaerolineales bacterium]